ncbi:MAG TPA: hypothetical protein VGD98_22335 [Ktedonobacteraceae bacterium]
MQYSRGYLLGRLLVLLAQQGVLEEAVEQVYARAAVAPPQVFPQALAALIAAGKEETILSMMTLLPLATFEGGLNRREQGAFALGYIHERTGIVLPVDEEEDGSEEGAELSERYEFRAEPALKEWIKTRGGGAFVRTLLRAERAKALQAQEKPTQVLE